MPENRFLLTVFLSSVTIVGVFAGAKIAAVEEAQKIVESKKESGFALLPAPLETDHSFYASAEPAEVATHATTSAVALSEPSAMENNITPAPPAPPKDPVKAESYVVGDLETGEVYLEKNGNKVLPFASMSKLITALVARDIYKATTTVAITPEETQVPQDMSALKAGEKFTVGELLLPMLLNSSNVAAEAISSSTNRMRFLELMSSYAWEIGMANAFFADPTGLSEKNAGTARGFFSLAQYLYKKRPDILAITRIPKATVATTTDHSSHEFTSIHPFVSDPRFIGGKTGHTPAAEDTMLTMMRIDGRPIAIIVLKSPGNRAADTQYLIDKMTALFSSDRANSL